MSPTSFALILTGVVLNAFAQGLLKAGTNRLGDVSLAAGRGVIDLIWRVLTIWPFLLGFACYGISLVVWIAALTRVPVTIAYPMLSIGYVINALVARYWLGESLSGTGWLALGLICAGVALLARQG